MFIPGRETASYRDHKAAIAILYRTHCTYILVHVSVFHYFISVRYILVPSKVLTCQCQGKAHEEQEQQLFEQLHGLFWFGNQV